MMSDALGRPPANPVTPGGPLVTSTMEYSYNLNGTEIEESDDDDDQSEGDRDVEKPPHGAAVG